MTWFAKLNFVQPNGDQEFVVNCDFYDDQVMDAATKTPQVQFSYAPSFPNGTTSDQVLAAINAFGAQVRDQRAKLDALTASIPVGKTIQIT